jgi:hypothetical protein
MASSAVVDSETYPYNAALNKREIRLLDVEIIKDFQESIDFDGEVTLANAAVQYGFRIVSLDNHPIPAYTAISYFWGNSRPVCGIELTSGGYLPLSRTLLGLLEALIRNALSSDNSKFTIWVDALCINQQDPVEKAVQVLQLGEVYTFAKEVLVWLGTGSPTSQRAFKYMRTKELFAKEKNLETEDDLHGLLDVFRVLRRPWFKRVWVIQEVTLNSNVAISCGEDRIEFHIFEHCIDRIWNFLDYPDWTDAAAGLLSVTRLLALRDTYQRKGKVSYETLLEASFHCEATDFRDKVYAFRGIADNTRPVPYPDYFIFEIDLFIKTACALLCHGTCLDLLALCGLNSNEIGNGQVGSDQEQSTDHNERTAEWRKLPSWAPDLRLLSWDEPFVVADAGGWNAGGKMRASPSAHSDNNNLKYLRLTARPISIVTQACPPFQCNSVTGQQEVLAAFMSFKPALVDMETWKEGLASTLIWGLNIDDKPDLEGYRESFDEWLKWLHHSTNDEDLANMAHNKFHLTLKTRVNTWRAFMTADGFLGIGPPVVEEGDIVFVVPGCRLPLVLRPEASVAYGQTDLATPLRGKLSLVGWSFVEGLMFGEAQVTDKPLFEVTLY